jgi:hypothetical protein
MADEDPEPRTLTLVTLYVEPPTRILDRGPGFYVEHARELFAATSLPTVCFVDERHAPAFRAAAPPGARIRFETIRWDELPTTRWVDRVRENRVRAGTLGRLGRNTPEYLALVASKFHVLERVLETDPFASSHFAWIDVGLSHAVGRGDLAWLDREIVTSLRDRVRICQIHRRPPEVLRDLDLLYGPEHIGRTTFAAGFFTARADVMADLVRAASDVFVETVERGYGYTEEAILATVYGRRPEWFDWYHGDYYGVLANYDHLRADLECVIRFFIEEAVAQGAFGEAVEACRAVHAAVEAGAPLGPDLLAQLHFAWATSAFELGDEYRAECALARLRLGSLALASHVRADWRARLDRIGQVLDGGTFDDRPGGSAR